MLAKIEVQNYCLGVSGRVLRCYVFNIFLPPYCLSCAPPSASAFQGGKTCFRSRSWASSRSRTERSYWYSPRLKSFSFILPLASQLTAIAQQGLTRSSLLREIRVDVHSYTSHHCCSLKPPATELIRGNNYSHSQAMH